MFESWVGDSPETLTACFQSDAKYWKLKNIYFDPGDARKTEQMIKDSYAMLKDVFTYMQSRSECHPYLS